MGKGLCWKGYQRVPGTTKFTKGSCRKVKRKKPKVRRKRR